jgi:hypothetical protein
VSSDHSQPLPIEFLEGRGQACLYVCLAGWAELFTDWLASATRILIAEMWLRDCKRDEPERPA